MVSEHIPSPVVNARNKIEHIYTGNLKMDLALSMIDCDPDVSVYLGN
jgi:hypothetical protein